MTLCRTVRESVVGDVVGCEYHLRMVAEELRQLGEFAHAARLDAMAVELAEMSENLGKNGGQIVARLGE
jgi:hypothetical protein